MPQKKRTVTKKRVGKARPAKKSRAKGNVGQKGGDYDKPWATYGAKIGGRVGSHFGARAGSKVDGLAQYVGRIFGNGDYTVGTPPSTNSLFVGSGKLPYDPTITFGEHSIRIKHREYLNDIITHPTANTFQVINYSVNPGLTNVFPWLSQIAPSYQTYRWHGLVVEFKSTSGDALNSTNTALGTVIMATDYNAQTINAPFLSKQEMLNYSMSVQCKPSASALMGIECDPKQMVMERLYIRTALDSANSDLRLSDACSFGVATSGFQAGAVNIGELYMVYDVEFFMEKDNIPGFGNLFARGNFSNGQIANQVGSLNTTGLMGGDSSWGYNPGANILLSNYNHSGNYAVITISDHTLLSNGMVFQFDYLTQGAISANSVGAPLPTLTPGTVFEGWAQAVSSPTASIAATTVMLSIRFKIIDVNALLRSIGGSYTLVKGFPNARDIFALKNTELAAATTSVPLSVNYTRWSLALVNPASALGI